MRVFDQAVREYLLAYQYVIIRSTVNITRSWSGEVGMKTLIIR